MDDCCSGGGEVEGLTDEYTALESLSMVNVGLASLSKLPSLPKLRKVSDTPPVPTMHCPGAPPVLSGHVFVCAFSAGGKRQHHRRRFGHAGGKMSQPDVPEPEREQDQRAERHRGSGEFMSRYHGNTSNIPVMFEGSGFHAGPS